MPLLSVLLAISALPALISGSQIPIANGVIGVFLPPMFPPPMLVILRPLKGLF